MHKVYMWTFFWGGAVATIRDQSYDEVVGVIRDTHGLLFGGELLLEIGLMMKGWGLLQMGTFFFWGGGIIQKLVL